LFALPTRGDVDDARDSTVIEYSPNHIDVILDFRKGPSSDMDSAIARAERSGDDSEPTDGLTRREHDILAFERQWWKYAGSKEDAIKELFSMSATRYYQVLNALVDRPEALAADPMLVKRLRRLRASRQKARAARRLGFDVT
jgi:hypothetical protein